MRRISQIILVALALTFIVWVSWGAMAQESWKKQLPGIGTFSSPRVADLNGDAIGDIILGAGRQEFEACDSAVIALDGRTGELLWNISAKDQIFGSASLKDITGDGVMDVFISGRSAELIVIDGAHGKVVWRFEKPKKQKKEWFNFYNPQFVPDQNGDGIEDLLVSNGGDVMAEPYDPERPVGYLLIIDSKTGEVISKAPMPDGKETYMSVVYLPDRPAQDKNIIYGTGGETIGGNLFLTSLQEVREEDLSNSIKLATSDAKGFIGPPAWVEITGDSILDIAAISVDGRILTFNGATYEPIWSTLLPGTEAYTSLAIGLFTRDYVPDFFVSVAKGVWPDLNWSRQFMVNGKNGQIEFTDSLGYYQMSSAVVIDANGDGLEEVLMPLNFQTIDSSYQQSYYSTLAIINFMANEVIELVELSNEGNNLASTPWVGDLDNDGFLDLIYCHSTNLRQIYTFDGFQVNRIETKLPVKQKPKWGAYMGSNYDGVYK